MDYKRIEGFIAKYPDKTLKEIGSNFLLSDKTIWHITKQLNITYKKTIPLRGKAGRFEARVSKTVK